MSEIKDRVLARRKLLKMTQKALAKKAGVKQQNIQQLEDGQVKRPRYLLELAAALECDAKWLATGKGAENSSLSSARHPDTYSGELQGRRADDGVINTREGPQVRGLVPLISSVQAGEWCDMVSSFEASDAEYWLPCPVKHGPHTFCLVVEGESMKNPHGKPSYDPGDIIFVDPEVTPTTGSRVVVRLESQQKATFKQYVEEDGQCMLKALNPDWKPRYVPLSERAAVCGVVIGKWVEE